MCVKNTKIFRAVGMGSHFLAGEASGASFAAVVVAVGAALCHVARLQVVECAAHAKGGAVEPAPPELEGEQEPRPCHQGGAPRWKAPTAQGQHVLRHVSCPNEASGEDIQGKVACVTGCA